MLIHSDQAAGTVRTVGWVFLLPWMFCGLVGLFCCYLWVCDWEDCRKKLLVATYWHYTKSCRVDLGQWFSELRWKWSKPCTKSSFKTFNATGKNWLRTLQVCWILTYSLKLTRKETSFPVVLWSEHQNTISLSAWIRVSLFCFFSMVYVLSPVRIPSLVIPVSLNDIHECTDLKAVLSECQSRFIRLTTTLLVALCVMWK